MLLGGSIIPAASLVFFRDLSWHGIWFKNFDQFKISEKYLSLDKGGKMKKLTAKLSLLAILMALSASAAYADSNENLALQNQVSSLNDKVDRLERQLRTVEGQVGDKQQHETGHAIVAAPSGGSLVNAAENINIGGHLDIQWAQNFRQPTQASNAGLAPETNIGRVFDRYDDSFTVNDSEIFIENPAEAPGEAGFRSDIMFGKDAEVVNSDGGTRTTDDAIDVVLQQAYVEYIAPLSAFEGNDVLPDSVKIKAGRFVTLAGAEVIEGPDNWNISRSFSFGFAIPFAHTGVRTNFGLFNDFFDVYLGVNNGWDNAVDNNAFKTLETGLGYKPMENVRVFHSLYFGGENNGSAAGKRILNTNVLTVDVTDKLSVMGALDLAHQARGGGVLVDGTNWWDIAGYVKYQLTDKFAVAYRAELFGDDDRFRTTNAQTYASAFTTDKVFGQTLTAEYKLTDDLIARGEFRHDKSSDTRPFAAGAESSQTSLGAQMVYII